MDDLATPTAGDLPLRSPGVMHRWVATAAMSRQLGCEKFLKCTRRMRGGKNHGIFDPAIRRGGKPWIRFV